MLLYEAIQSVVPTSVVQWTQPIHNWVPGVTPMSTPKEVFVGAVMYLVIVLGGQQIMRMFPAVPAKYIKLPFFLHNVFLTLGSLLLLLCYLERAVPFWKSQGFHDAVCDGKIYYELELLHIINYYFKYWEFVDTFFLVIKKKKLMFLHVYHHMATAVLCYTQIVAQTPVAWFVISINLAVHVVMYAYYGLSSIGISCPWKKWITTGQITQFVIDLCICNYTLYHYFGLKLRGVLPGVKPCWGQPIAALGAVMVLLSYLVLFILFYHATYNAKRKVKKTA
ncbi:Fatty acyl-CoA elongase/Polyunsaturated fatty acid specific elongation enzyme [Malassezia pachydermatis]|uniref:Elongation of fatty acids protein n=1 Tax=Malassezia pachydermatis TaxID=77020 RepID=A0A0M8MU68_9BASI|nr:fatty acid elongase [Malassezia pachydermatis]KOS13681.1 fatty acid elongase [Malassezia pachydermatis]